MPLVMPLTLINATNHRSMILAGTSRFVILAGDLAALDALTARSGPTFVGADFRSATLARCKEPYSRSSGHRLRSRYTLGGPTAIHPGVEPGERPRKRILAGQCNHRRSMEFTRGSLRLVQ